MVRGVVHLLNTVGAETRSTEGQLFTGPISCVRCKPSLVMRELLQATNSRRHNFVSKNSPTVARDTPIVVCRHSRKPVQHAAPAGKLLC